MNIHIECIFVQFRLSCHLFLSSDACSSLSSPPLLSCPLLSSPRSPMEEQRLRYGPHLYTLTKFVTYLRIFLALWWSSFDTSLT